MLSYIDDASVEYRFYRAFVFPFHYRGQTVNTIFFVENWKSQGFPVKYGSNLKLVVGLVDVPDMCFT